MLELQHITYTVQDDNGNPHDILKDVSLTIDERFVAITGPNGGGKSTLAKHFNAILLPIAVLTRNKKLCNLLLVWCLGALVALIANFDVQDAELFGETFNFYFFPHVLEFGIPILLFAVPVLGLLGIQIAQPAADLIAGLISIPFIIRFLRKEE